MTALIPTAECHPRTEELTPVCGTCNGSGIAPDHSPQPDDEQPCPECAMSDRREWDLSTPFSPAKSIHLPRVEYANTDQCDAMRVDGWGVERYCDRLPGHTGRHRADEWQHRYPVAVWS